MSSLLTDEEKLALSADISNVADTFERDIYVYSEAEQVIITTDPNYNRNYSYNQNDPVNVVVPVRNKIKARIWYEKALTLIPLNDTINARDTTQQVAARVATGRVRIKVRPEGHELLKDAKRVEFDGTLFGIDSISRPHGLFVTDFYTYWLTPQE